MAVRDIPTLSASSDIRYTKYVPFIYGYKS